MGSKLTKRRVDAAKPDATLWDGDLPGFGLRVSKGGVRSYVLKYRRGGVQRWLTIGRHGAPWTPETARIEAKRLIGKIAAGGDPAADKADARGAETLTAFSERYLATYARPHKRASSVAEDARNLKNHILPALGRHQMRTISRADVAAFHLGLGKTPYAANRCLSLLSHMFRKAELWSVRPEGSNPCRHVERFEERPRERFLSLKELQRLGRALRAVDRAGEAPYTVAAIRLLLFTGARLTEILALRWAHVDLAARVIRLPVSKTGAKIIALPAPAVEILNALPKIKGNPFVICGRKTGESLKNLQRPWRRLRKAALLDKTRLHDLRHSFASVAMSGGLSLPLIGALLGHTQPQTTQRYAHLAGDARQAAANAVASVIDANLKGDAGQIIPMRKTR